MFVYQILVHRNLSFLREATLNSLNVNRTIHNSWFVYSSTGV